jgi:hypothetical protein
MKLTEKKQAAVDLFCRYIEAAREVYEKNHADALTLPSPAIVRHALEGIIKNDGTRLRSAPTFRERPIASVVHRMIAWHNSGGDLHRMMGAIWDAKSINKSADAPLVEGLTPAQIEDQLQTLALTLVRGNSPAVGAWKHALRGE